MKMSQIKFGTSVIAALIGVCGIVASSFAQPGPQAGIVPDTRFEYQVALPGGTWGSSVSINPGDRVEWRVVLTYTGTMGAVALGRVYYQPVMSNVDNDGIDAQVDRLGDWRNGGFSGQANTVLSPGILSAAEGHDSASLTDYGRVVYGFTSRNTNVGSSGPLTQFRHTAGSNGAPAGSFLRIAGSNNQLWYPQSIPFGTVPLNNQILQGVVSDNNAPTSTWFAIGTQSIVLFRQSFIASSDESGFERVVRLYSEPATLQRAGGSTGPDDTRFMTWAMPGEGGSTATLRSSPPFIEYVSAEIRIVPSSGTIGLLGIGTVLTIRRRR